MWRRMSIPGIMVWMRSGSIFRIRSAACFWEAQSSWHTRSNWPMVMLLVVSGRRQTRLASFRAARAVPPTQTRGKPWRTGRSTTPKVAIVMTFSM